MSKDAELRRERGAVAVYGATGHTGRFVVAELVRRGFAVTAVARDPAKLTSGFPEVRTRVATTADPVALREAFAGVDAVVNCAGPFVDTADAVAEAAVGSGAHYLDVTAEAASAQRTFDRWDAPARAAGVAVIPAMGFYGGLADLLTTAATGGRPAEEIRIGIALDSWHPTPGTLITGRRNTGPRLMLAAGRPHQIPSEQPATTWTFSEPFGDQAVVELPFSEFALITRHVPTCELHTFLNETPLRDLRDPATPAPQPADDIGRSRQRFLVETIVRTANGTTRLTASGRDIYAVTAPLVGEAVERLLADPPPAGGAFAPGEVFPARAFLAALHPEHLRLDPMTAPARDHEPAHAMRDLAE